MTATALGFDAFGDPREVIHLKEVSLGEARPGSAVVRMRFCPINPSDLIPVTGAYAHRVVPPMVCGYEGLGMVEWADGSPVRSGARVVVTKFSGTWSQRIVVSSDKLIAVPDPIPDLMAARGFINPATCLALLRRYPVAGKRVLITGGGTTCALLLSRWARLQGAQRVTVITRSPRSRARYHDLDVQTLSGLPPEDLAEAASAEITFDCVGGAWAGRAAAAQAPSAVWVSYGLLSGVPMEETRTGARITRFYLRQEQEAYAPADWALLFDEIWRRLPGTPVPAPEVFPFRDFQRALEYYHSESRDRKPILEFGEL